VSAEGPLPRSILYRAEIGSSGWTVVLPRYHDVVAPIQAARGMLSPRSLRRSFWQGMSPLEFAYLFPAGGNSKKFRIWSTTSASLLR
jgi:hypothetical protein